MQSPAPRLIYFNSQWPIDYYFIVKQYIITITIAIKAHGQSLPMNIYYMVNSPVCCPALLGYAELS